MNKQKPIAIYLYIVLSVLLMTSCHKKATTGSMIDSAFYDLPVTNIIFTGEGVLDIKQGSEKKLVIDAEKAIQPFIGTMVIEPDLWIKVDTKKMPKGHKTPHFTIVLPKLSSLSFTGSAQVAISDIKSDTLKISASGNIALITSGTLNEQEIKAEGSINYNAEKLLAETCLVNVAGSSALMLNCKQLIKGTLAGSSSLTYLGNPKLDVAKYGSVSITQTK